MEEYISEPKQGEILGESEDEDLKTETSSEAKGSHGFKTDNLCMYAGETCKEGQFVDIVIQEKEGKQNQNSVLEEDEVIDGNLDYNILLGRPCIYAMVSVVSIYFRKIAFPFQGGITIVDQLTFFPNSSQAT